MTFTEWGGNMDWPLDPDWECEVCGAISLEWGIIHGVCRCTRCHAQYTMRHDGKRLTTPRSLLKPEYKKAARLGWKPLGLPLDEWTDHMWSVALQWVDMPSQPDKFPEPPQEFEQDPMNPCGATDPRF